MRGGRRAAAGIPLGSLSPLSRAAASAGGSGYKGSGRSGAERGGAGPRSAATHEGLRDPRPVVHEYTN